MVPRYVALAAPCAAAVFLPLLLTSQATPVFHNQTTAFQWNQTMYVLAFGDSYTYAQGTLGYADSTFIGSNLNFSYTLAQMIQPRTCHCTTSGPYNSLARPDDSCSPASPCSEISSTPTSHSQLSGPRSTILETRQSWTSIFSTYYDRLISTVFEQFVEPGLQGRVQEGVVHETATAGQDHSESCQDGGPACSPNKTMMGWWDGWQSRKPRFSICGAVKCEDVTALVFDSNAFLNRVLDHPAEYNITNTTLRCPEYDQPLLVTQYGGLPVEEYFWYNTGHMTTHTHKILAAELQKFPSACSS